MKERKLTEKELLRKEKFDLLCEKMRADGYEKVDLTVGVVAANLLSILIMAPFMAAVLLIFFAIASGGEFSYSVWESLALLPALIAFVVIHELIHGLAWGRFAGFKAIDFGVIWSMLTPYCTCGAPLKRWQYILGGLMPTIVLGTVLTVAACLSGSLFWLAMAEIMVLGGGGDFLIVLKMLLHKTKGKSALYYDHPYECGVVVFEK